MIANINANDSSSESTSSEEESNLSFNDLSFDSSRFKSELSSQKYTDDQLTLIKQLKTLHHFADETLNTIKLIIYDWDINECVKYYKNDKFCIDYFLDECKKNTEKKEEKSQQQHSKSLCPFNLEHKYHFYTIWNKMTPDGFKFLKQLLEYLLYTNKRPNSSNLYGCYGHVLRGLIKTRKDALECEKYFVKSISLNSKNCDAHSGYGILLTKITGHLYNFNKGLKHYELSCSVENDPNASLFCVNYASTLARHATADEDNKKVLFYARKAISYKQSTTLDTAYFIAALATYILKDYKQCIEYNENRMQLSNNFARNDYLSSYVAAKMFVLAQDKHGNTNNNNNDDDIDDNTNNNNIDDDDISNDNIDDITNDKKTNWDQLYDDYIESDGCVFSLILDDKNIKYLSYFDEMEVHNNNKILKTNNDIDHLVNGYVTKNTKDIYDLSALVKIIKKYFGPPGNQVIFTVRYNYNYSSSQSISTSISTTTTNMIMSTSSLALGHLYRTIIFNKPLFDMKTLTSQAVKFKIIQSHICDYWAKNSGRWQLGFGFTIGVIVIDKNEKAAVDCNSNNNNNKNYNDGNPLLLSRNMNLYVTDLPVIYSKAVKFLAASHFVFDQDENNFVRAETFHLKFVNGNFDGLSKVVDRTFGKRIQSNEDLSVRIDIGETVEIDVACQIAPEHTVLGQCNIISPMLNKIESGSDDENGLNLCPYQGRAGIAIYQSEAHRCSNFCWLPVFSCSGCNCQSCSDSPLVLSLIE